jgi:TetR/AcrR family transcriptional repressor of mexJK operon
MQIPCLPSICDNPSRREARRHSRREAILDVAERSFLHHGYAASTMSGIAAELGGSKGTLWSYFPAKDVLFAAVLDRATEMFQHHLTVILNPQDEMGTTLQRFARDFLQRVTSPEALALNRLVMAEATRFPETGRIFYERAMGRTRGVLAAYLFQQMELGHLRRDDPMLAAQQLVALCLSGCHQMLMIRMIDHPDAALIEADVYGAVATFQRAYQL